MAQKLAYSPRPTAVRTGVRGRPEAVQGVDVAQVKEEWLVEDGWWTETPLKRHYFELVLRDGRNLVVFRDERDDPAGSARGRWYLQRA